MDVVQAARAVADDIMREVWPHIDDPSFHEAVLRSTIDNLATIFARMAGEAVPEGPPPGAIEVAETTARMGVPIGEVDKAYRIGTTSLWNMWFDAARDHADGGPIDELISGPTMMMHEHVNCTLDAVVLSHQQTRGEMHRTLSQLRREALTEVLGGHGDGDEESLSRTLDYRLADTHLALLVESPDGQQPDAVIAAARAVVDARNVMLHRHAPRTWVVWLGRTTGFDPRQLAALGRTLSGLDVTIAVGEAAPGLCGLRRTYRQALETARVQRAFGASAPRCLWAREVRLETLLLADEARAREFIEDELGRLAGVDANTCRLRETLLAWLATGSHVSAAAMLGVHENTVRNRIRAAEELLGTPLLGRRTELQVALRLERVLAAPQGDVAAAA